MAGIPKGRFFALLTRSLEPRVYLCRQGLSTKNIFFLMNKIIENIFLPLMVQLQHLLQNVRGQAPARFVISAATLGTMRRAKGEKARLIKRTGTVLSMSLYKCSPALAGLPL
ncbi:hypothetical protein M5X17_04045 [Paenibacillus alvei]|nr:hypothetical protein [Paenibacillus alvei]MCY9540521.1 hypothetical protein [Paenibacillus alvei]MCY9708275.1 hypothetical protein [Paenibacillus alvei]MCY9732930.1 hypothetical protein [Paenibacillus alvei]MEC0080326.1 hypothetical protein [Paenibacillus alvei]